MQKLKYFGSRTKDKIWNWSTSRKIIYGLILLLVVFLAYKGFGPKDITRGVMHDTVKQGDLKDTVLATGQVVSNTELDLSFSASGLVKSLRIKVGDKVGAGAVLAALDQSNVSASLTKARGGLAAAEAKYQKILAGASNEEIKLAEVALKNAKDDYERVLAEQNLLVENAYKAFQSSKLSSDYDKYEVAVKTKESAAGSAQDIINQKEAELVVKKSSARQPEIDLAKADILSAQGELEIAQANFEHTIIRTPARGTITKVDVRYGELAEANKPVITLQDVGSLYIEALINESDIASLKIGQAVDISFDAFGGSRKLTGTVALIDPSAETSDGVVNYKIKVSIKNSDPAVRPGMNANIEVLAGEAKNVLSIPAVAIKEKDGKSFVQVLVDKKAYEEREVITGFKGDSNLIEIISGLSEGEEVALNKK